MYSFKEYIDEGMEQSLGRAAVGLARFAFRKRRRNVSQTVRPTRQTQPRSNAQSTTVNQPDKKPGFMARQAHKFDSYMEKKVGKSLDNDPGLGGKLRRFVTGSKNDGTQAKRKEQYAGVYHGKNKQGETHFTSELSHRHDDMTKKGYKLVSKHPITGKFGGTVRAARNKANQDANERNKPSKDAQEAKFNKHADLQRKIDRLDPNKAKRASNTQRPFRGHTPAKLSDFRK